MCTVHSFPHNIDHCLTFARSEFEGFMEKAPAEANAFLADPAKYIAAIRQVHMPRSGAPGTLVACFRAPRTCVPSVPSILRLPTDGMGMLHHSVSRFTPADPSTDRAVMQLCDDGRACVAGERRGGEGAAGEGSGGAGDRALQDHGGLH